MRYLYLLLTLALLLPAQGKRPIKHSDYDSWRALASQTLSRDGKWLAYSLFPQAGDGELIVRDLATGKEHRHNAGALPPPPEPDPEAEPRTGPPPPRGIRILFTSDLRHAVATTFPTKEATDKARKERKKAEEMPKNGAIVVELATGAATRLDSVKSIQVTEKGEPWIAWLKDSGSPAPQGEQQRGRAPGTELSLLKPGATPHTFNEVSEFALAKDGRLLVYAVSSKQEESNGVYSVTPGGDAAPAGLVSGKGRYSRLTWDRDHKQMAFLSSLEGKSKLHFGDGKAVDGSETWSITDRAPLGFSRDGGRLFLSTGPASRPERPQGAASAGEERVIADLWHYRDPYIQPMQKVRAAQDRSRSYRGVYDIAAKKFTQLADESMAAIAPSDDGARAIGVDDRRYRSMVDFDGRYADYYLVDATTGSRRLLAERLRGGGFGASAVSFSPDAKHVLYYRDGNWFAAAVDGGAAVNLTSGLGVKFHDEEDDTPDPASSYGTGGWTMDGKFVLLYDRYDIWQVSPDGNQASNLTDGVGRRRNMQFRLVRLQEDEEQENRGLDPAKPLTLSAVDQTTRASGFFRDTISGKEEPRQLLMQDKSLRFAGKAKDAEVALIAATTFREAGDLQVTDMNFANPRKVTSANPQQEQLLWGSGELIHFRNVDGEPLQAALYKPENFDPKKKYPLMVYIYERLSQQVHSFAAPSPGTSVNRAYYVSNGYLFLMPDISYRIGSPGQSALKCVLPAIDEVVRMGIVDEKAIGIQGHSWGGYQIAYMVTQTNRFKAAVAGAPVGNMTSAYNGIRWGSGLPRQFQYEQTQSRIGGSLWERPMRFLENSPVFMADRVSTPLLILHNDEDDAVPWYQGIELFLSLRRNGKEAYMMNYNGEKHGIRRRHNQQDWTRRMQEFFDHHLRGAAKPDWMANGIPYIDREREKSRRASDDR
ncbi:MAG: S9 family peptidase [Acidimicrobiia bacterium]|nr:S9 family peptidase [Acidimicrobiia bacterium]